MATSKPGKPLQPETAAHESLVYREIPVDRLKGGISKWVTVGAGEVGLITQSGQVQRTLPPGRHRVGWRFWGLGSTSSFGTLPTAPFPLVLRFPHLGEEFKDPLDGFTQATVVISDPAKFCRDVVGGGSRLSAARLAGIVSKSALVILDRLAARFDPSMLRADPKAGERLSEQIYGPLGDQLAIMGLRLVSLGEMLFKQSSESDHILEAAAQIEAELAGLTGDDAAAAAATIKKAQQFVDMAGETRFVSEAESDGLRSALDLAAGFSGSPDLGALKNAFSQLVGGRSSERARALSPGEACRLCPASHKMLYAIESLLMIGPLIVLLADGLSWFFIGRPNGESWQTHHAVAGGLIIFMLASVKVVSAVRKHAQSRWAEQDKDIPWLKRWLTDDAARVDETIRGQVATNIESGALPDIRSAADACQMAGSRDESQSLRGSADAARLLAMNIRSAPKASTMLHSGKAEDVLKRGNRLIAFEEKTLALSRRIVGLARGLKTKTLTTALEKADVVPLIGAVDDLRQHFLSRDAVIAGIPLPGDGAGVQAK